MGTMTLSAQNKYCALALWERNWIDGGNVREKQKKKCVVVAASDAVAVDATVVVIATICWKTRAIAHKNEAKCHWNYRKMKNIEKLKPHSHKYTQTHSEFFVPRTTMAYIVRDWMQNKPLSI